MKKLISLFIIVFSCIGINAAAAEYASVPACTVTLNGQIVDNSYRQFPLLQYRDIVYFPMTYYDCRFLGVSTNWSSSTQTLDINTDNISCAYRDYTWQWKNSIKNKIDICKFNILVNGEAIDNSTEEYPLITFRDVTYFPLTWRFAAEGFDWEYSYDEKAGLVIASDNYVCEKMPTPSVSGVTFTRGATDGKYYYYAGSDANIYRMAVDGTSAEVIHTTHSNMPYSNLPSLVTFKMYNGNMYISYHSGGASMGTDYHYRINPNGTLTRTDEAVVYQSFLGGNIATFRENGFTVTRTNSGHRGSTQLYYTDAAVEKKELVVPGVQLAEKHFVGIDDWDFSNDPQFIGDKMYVTGYDKDKVENSRLYCYNLKTGECNSLVENVGVFFAFTGWDVEAMQDSPMFIFYRDGQMLRYSCATGKTIVINEAALPLKAAMFAGDSIYCYTENLQKSEVTLHMGYGTGSLQGIALFSTMHPTHCEIIDGNLCTRSFVDDESLPYDVKTCVFHKDGSVFRTCDETGNIFIYDNILIYSLLDKYGINKLVKVNLAKR